MAKSKCLSREIDGQTVTTLPVALDEVLFMAESPDRRPIERAANLVNERLPRELHALAPACRAGNRSRDPLDNSPHFGYNTKNLAHQGRLSRGHFRKTERDAVPARGWMRSAPGRLWGTGRPAKRTGPHGACLTQGTCGERAKHLGAAP